MCNCNCDCCNSDKNWKGYSAESVRLAEKLREKAIRNLEKTPEGRRRLKRHREEGRL